MISIPTKQLRKNSVTMKALTALSALLALTGVEASAQQYLTKAYLPLYRDAEQIGNLYSQSRNPAGLRFSPVDGVLDFNVGYDLTRGELHDVDESGHINMLNVGLSGQQRFGNIVCQGGISYDDGKALNRRWNSTSVISADNPFILGDSIRSDFNSQYFKLRGRVAYNPTDALTLGIELGYDATSSANQTDPRPKTDGALFNIAPGALLRLSDSFTLGLAARYTLMSEGITHTIVDTRESYVYFRFNGLGGYSVMGTGTSSSYPRDYKGHTIEGSAQLQWTASCGLESLLEPYYRTLSETARDGGAVFTFKGGDFSSTQYGLSEKLRLGRSDRRHTLTLSASAADNSGDWYDQTSYSDPNKNNQLSFRVERKVNIYSQKRQSLGADYRFDKMRSAQAPLFTLGAAARIDHVLTEWTDGDYYHREYTNLTGSLSGAYHLGFGRDNLLSASLTLKGSAPLSREQSVAARIQAIYTDPQAEYATATTAGGDLALRYSRLIRGLWVGAYAEASYTRFLGTGHWTDLLNNSDRRSFAFGLQLYF